MEKIKLVTILEGKSSEYPISLYSTGSLIHKINKRHHELILIGISKDGKQYTYDGGVDGIEHDTRLCEEHRIPCVLSSSEGCRGSLKLHADGTFTRIEVDCIFPILYGENGEGGTIQGLFELSGISYVGCGYMSSAICMDKGMAHIVVERAGISCTLLVCVYETDDLDYRKAYEHAKETLGLPIFIKPANAGSSFEIHRIESFDGLEKTMKDTFYHDGESKVILGTTTRGLETRVAVIGNKEFFAGSMDEIGTAAPSSDCKGKYEVVDSHIYCPIRISLKLFEEAKEIAKEAYRTVNYEETARVDMSVTPEDTTILSGVNTIPGFTDTSYYSTMMKEADIPFPKLIDRLVALATEG